MQRALCAPKSSQKAFFFFCRRERMSQRRHIWSGDIAGDVMEKPKDDWLSAAHTMCDLSPGDTTVSLSELYGNKKQLSKCHSVTSTIDGCRVVGHGDESLVWHSGQKLPWILWVEVTHRLGEVLLESVSKGEVKLERWLDNARVGGPIFYFSFATFYMYSFLEQNCSTMHIYGCLSSFLLFTYNTVKDYTIK